MKHQHVHVAHRAFYAVMDTMKANDASKGSAWLGQDVETHLAHAREHLHQLNRGDRSEDHLRHAVTRMAMALYIQQPPKASGDPITFDTEDYHA